MTGLEGCQPRRRPLSRAELTRVSVAWEGSRPLGETRHSAGKGRPQSEPAACSPCAPGVAAFAGG
jgi:hypothetical protein